MLKFSGNGQSQLKLSGVGNKCKPLPTNGIQSGMRSKGSALYARPAMKSAAPRLSMTCALANFAGSARSSSVSPALKGPHAAAHLKFFRFEALSLRVFHSIRVEA